MNTLLVLNGPEGWQTGIEDGFSAARTNGLIKDFLPFYLDAQCQKLGAAQTERLLVHTVRSLRPNLVFLFHIGRNELIEPLLACLADLQPRPVLVYDEGDMYGGLAKPITRQMKRAMATADLVSIRGLGPFCRAVRRVNPSIVYTPHHADLARFDATPPSWSSRDLGLTFIGNRNKPRLLPSLRRLPGAAGREAFIRGIGDEFGPEFHLYGNGWTGFTGDHGALPFERQMEIYRRSRITVAYEHYPKVSYYFSNRLPMALMSGSLYVCHEHDGYQDFFKGQDFIFFFRNTATAFDIVRYLATLDEATLAARSGRARAFALAHLTPQIVWPGLVRHALSVLERRHHGTR